MTLDDIIANLKHGELSAHGMFADTVLSEQNKERIITAINIALTELYSRFPLLTKELTIIQKSNICEYVIDNAYAMSNTTDNGLPRYIMDTKADPYSNDLLRIEYVVDEIGDMLTLNSDMGCKVALTPAVNVLEIPNPVDTNALFVVYRARHPYVTATQSDVNVPYQFLSALLSYVAHRIYSGGTAQEHVVISQTLFQKYEMFCMQQQNYGMTNQHDTERSGQFCSGGWV